MMNKNTAFTILTILSLVASAAAQMKQSKTVRDYFMLLPDKYFLLECCARKSAHANKAEYLKRLLEIEDTANGFLQGASDGAQSGFKMTLFKRPDKTHLVGFSTAGEGGEAYYFLEYKNGKWRDVSKQVVPEYSERKIYELPRRGTTVEVFEMIGNELELSIGEKGAKLYDLEWKNGKFSIKK
jgi:hypothetical protein